MYPLLMLYCGNWYPSAESRDYFTMKAVYLAYLHQKSARASWTPADEFEGWLPSHTASNLWLAKK